MISHDVQHQLSEFGEARSEQMMSELQAVFVGPFASHCLFRTCEEFVRQDICLDTMYLNEDGMTMSLSKATSGVEISLCFFFWMTPCQTCLKKETTEKNHMTCSCFHEGLFFPVEPL